MKYNIAAFNSEVKYYQDILRPIRAKTFLFVFDVKDEQAYYAVAPLSRVLAMKAGSTTTPPSERPSRPIPWQASALNSGLTKKS